MGERKKFYISILNIARYLIYRNERRKSWNSLKLGLL